MQWFLRRQNRSMLETHRRAQVDGVAQPAEQHSETRFSAIPRCHTTHGCISSLPLLPQYCSSIVRSSVHLALLQNKQDEIHASISFITVTTITISFHFHVPQYGEKCIL